MQVESMYVVRWAGKLFSVPGLSISPLVVTKATVDADGSFVMDLPASPMIRYGTRYRKMPR